MSFRHIKPGDTVIRMLAGTVRCELHIIEVTEDLIVSNWGHTFDRDTGAEIDEDLGWNNTLTGSFLVHEN